MKQFKTIKKEAEAELIEKKSKFIANIFYIEQMEDIENKLKKIKATYTGAKHYCYAYRLIYHGQIIEKSSDDR